jgi:hypothetical protein
VGQRTTCHKDSLTAAVDAERAPGHKDSLAVVVVDEGPLSRNSPPMSHADSLEMFVRVASCQGRD